MTLGTSGTPQDSTIEYDFYEKLGSKYHTQISSRTSKPLIDSLWQTIDQIIDFPKSYI